MPLVLVHSLINLIANFFDFACLVVRRCARFLCSFSFVHIKELRFSSTTFFKDVNAAAAVFRSSFGFWSVWLVAFICEEFHPRTLYIYQSPVGIPICTDLHLIIEAICFVANFLKHILIIFHFHQRILKQRTPTFKGFTGTSCLTVLLWLRV